MVISSVPCERGGRFKTNGQARLCAFIAYGGFVRSIGQVSLSLHFSDVFGSSELTEAIKSTAKSVFQQNVIVLSVACGIAQVLSSARRVGLLDHTKDIAEPYG
ncbi:hypothetical protein RsTz2092_12030 [Deferribacterales bacterium RsTz2092]